MKAAFIITCSLSLGGGTLLLADATASAESDRPSLSPGDSSPQAWTDPAAPAVSNPLPASDVPHASLPARNHLADPNYQLQPDDVLEVAVFREPDLTTDGMIRKDGTFDMKLVGAVNVAGLTADKAAEKLRVALARDYLVDPRVTVGLVDYARRKVDILGEVRSPGVYGFPARGPLLLTDAVALAGGFLPNADSGHVGIRREDTTLETDAASAHAPPFYLHPDDVVRIAPLLRHHFTVLGQVARPGTYEFTDEHAVYLTDAIAVAGGYTRIADPGRVLLKRTEDGQETVRKFNARAMANRADTQRMPVRNEDIITVCESIF